MPETKTLAELTEEKNKIKNKLGELQDQITTEERHYSADENAIVEALFEDLRSVNNELKTARLDDESESFRNQIHARNFSLANTPENQLSEQEKNELVYRQAFYDYMLNGKSMDPQSKQVLNTPPSRSVFDAPRGRSAANYYKGPQNYARRAYESWKKFASAIQEQISWGPNNPEKRDQSVGVPAEGGYLVPEGFSNEITEQMAYYGGMRNVARIYPTATGNNIPWPTWDDTAAKAIIVGEGVATTEGQLTFGQTTLLAYKYSTQYIPVSWELLQDSFFDFEALIARAFAVRMGRGTNEHFTTGTGTAQPLGIVPSVNTINLPAGGGEASLTFDVIKELVYAVNRDYRVRPRTAFMFHDTVEKLIYQLSVGSADARALWQPGFAEGVPDRILGYPYEVNNDMPTDFAVGVSQPSIMLFGDWEHYIIRDIAPLMMMRLDEINAINGQVVFLGWARFDGRPVFASTSDTPIKGLNPPTV